MLQVNIKTLIDDGQCYQTVRICAGQTASRVQLVSPHRLFSAVLMTQHLLGNAMSVPTVINGLMI